MLSIVSIFSHKLMILTINGAYCPKQTSCLTQHSISYYRLEVIQRAKGCGMHFLATASIFAYLISSSPNFTDICAEGLFVQSSAGCAFVYKGRCGVLLPTAYFNTFISYIKNFYSLDSNLGNISSLHRLPKSLARSAHVITRTFGSYRGSATSILCCLHTSPNNRRATLSRDV
jgi:hypothetical protein